MKAITQGRLGPSSHDPFSDFRCFEKKIFLAVATLSKAIPYDISVNQIDGYNHGNKH